MKRHQTNHPRRVLQITAVTTLALGAAPAVLGDSQRTDSQIVRADSLQVKERLRSLEQINVTTEKAPVNVSAISQSVTDLLKEADAMDARQEQLDTQSDANVQ